MLSQPNSRTLQPFPPRPEHKHRGSAVTGTKKDRLGLLGASLPISPGSFSESPERHSSVVSPSSVAKRV